MRSANLRRRTPATLAASLLTMGVPLALTAPASGQATLLQPGFTITQVAGGLVNATAMEFAPDGRIFVTQQGGALRVIENGTLLATPFISLSVNSIGERGLLGIAFDPDFATNRHLYVYYTRTQLINGVNRTFNRVSRFTADPDNPNIALANSELEILRLEFLSATNHNGGAIHFGPDGKLYVAVGENAVPANSQSLNNRLGKILRINPDGSIPEDNPFFNTATGDNRAIWALGLRNPFTFAFQPGTGQMFINDVGQSTWEEINVGLAGANYGWGSNPGSTTGPNEGPFNPASAPAFTSPLYAYLHGNGLERGRSIAGAAFYNPAQVRTFGSEFMGDYFFADYVNSWISWRDSVTGTVTSFASNASNPLDLRVWDDGSLYYLSRGSGSVFRITGEFNVSLSAPEPGAGLLALAGLLFFLRRRQR